MGSQSCSHVTRLEYTTLKTGDPDRKTSQIQRKEVAYAAISPNKNPHNLRHDSDGHCITYACTSSLQAAREHEMEQTQTLEFWLQQYFFFCGKDSKCFVVVVTPLSFTDHIDLYQLLAYLLPLETSQCGHTTTHKHDITHAPSQRELLRSSTLCSCRPCNFPLPWCKKKKKLPSTSA